MSSSEYQLRKCADLRTISQEWTVCILEFFDTSQVKTPSDDYETNKKD